MHCVQSTNTPAIRAQQWAVSNGFSDFRISFTMQSYKWKSFSIPQWFGFRFQRQFRNCPLSSEIFRTAGMKHMNNLVLMILCFVVSHTSYFRATSGSLNHSTGSDEPCNDVYQVCWMFLFTNEVSLIYDWWWIGSWPSYKKYSSFTLFEQWIIRKSVMIIIIQTLTPNRHRIMWQLNSIKFHKKFICIFICNIKFGCEYIETL